MRFMPRSPVSLVVAALTLGLIAATARADAGADTIAAALQRGGTIELAGRPIATGMLNRIYQARGYRPIWTAARRDQLIAALAEAPSHGLDPDAFAAPNADSAAAELLLTDCFLRYTLALGRGLVTMGDIGRNWGMPQPSLDPSAILDRALNHGVAATLAALAPQDADYTRLRQAYLRYREYTRRAAWGPIAVKLPLRLGASGADVIKLRHRLAAEGFVPPSDSPDYDAALAVAVGRFQAAHGLPPDGAVGEATLAALNVTPEARLRTIRLNLERRRAMPRDTPATRIVVNVPDATLALDEAGQPRLTMRVIVGDPDHPTPELQASMTSVVINPPWIVPISIAANEILPLSHRDSGYLARNNFTFDGDQLIQRPGPKNALGRIKFEMPNRFTVYLHDTPAKALLARARRALSHGCIRLEHPRELARRVLSGDPQWTLTAIDAAIAAGVTRRVTLPHPILVRVVYWTAYVDADGTVEFRNDVYGRDRRLDEALVAHDMAGQSRPILQPAGAATSG